MGHALTTGNGVGGVLSPGGLFLACLRPRIRKFTTGCGRKGRAGRVRPYEPVEDWLKPLADETDGIKHEGWTWGSVGAVYAETPDRIWIAQRGELPLPTGAKPWTPYGMLMPPIQATGNGDGLSATCDPTAKRGWERRYHHVIFVVDRNGRKVEWWQDHDKDFEGKCGRGPHKIKMNPYDPEKHVWVIDDQLHVIYKFTYDGKLVMTLGTRGSGGATAEGCSIGRPTSTGCPTARSSSATATAACAWRSSTRTASS